MPKIPPEKVEAKRQLAGQFGKRIKQRLQELGMKQGQLAKAVNMDRTTLNKMINGKTAMGLEKLDDIAKHLRVSLDELAPSGALSNGEQIGEVSQVRGTMKPAAKPDPGGYIERHKFDLTPREQEYLLNLIVPYDDTATYDDVFWGDLVAAFRRSRSRK